MKKILIFLSLIIIIVGLSTTTAATDEINTTTTSSIISHNTTTQDVCDNAVNEIKLKDNNSNKINAHTNVEIKTQKSGIQQVKQAKYTTDTEVNTNESYDDIIYLEDGIHYYDFLNITRNTHIIGQSQNNTIIVNKNTHKNAMIQNNANLKITNLTITNSQYLTIRNYGNLTLDGVILTNSTGEYISDGFIKNYANKQFIHYKYILS